MSIALAFSTAICPEKSSEQAIELAKELGYSHLEFITTSPENPAIASDPLKDDPQVLAQLLKDAAIKPACIDLNICIHHKDKNLLEKTYTKAEHAFRVAKIIGCPYVRILGNAVMPHEARRRVISRMVENVNPLVQTAAEYGVTLLFENTGSFAKAKAWWTLLNMAEHPMLGICWNPTNAFANDEMPCISIPLLHHRIHLVHLSDFTEGAGNNFVALGQGSVPVEETVCRMMGIGYARILSVSYDQAWLGDATDVTAFLTQAKETIEAWMQVSADAIAAADVKKKKIAARNAPKPRQRAC